jgi:hypothetical protein
MRDLQEVHEVRLTGSAKLGAMAFRGDFIGTANQPGIFGRAVFSELGEEFFEASVELPLVAVAVKIKGNVSCRRHVLVYDGCGRDAILGVRIGFRSWRGIVSAKKKGVLSDALEQKQHRRTAGRFAL